MPVDLGDIRIITVSGKIGAGSTTLAKHLAKKLDWKHLEGGDIFWERVRKQLGLHPKDTHKRPDNEDQIFDQELKKIINEENHLVLETKLAGFNAQGVDGIYKILVICADKNGDDQPGIRIDRLLNREGVSMAEAKEEVIQREKNDIEKWRRIYADNDPEWVYWDPKYYDLVINTYSLGSKESLQKVLDEIGVKK
jgi:cytidylate kinase